MSNKIATVTVNVAYADADGAAATLAQQQFSALYQAQNHGQYDLPNETAAGDFDIPFGSIAGVTLAIVKNATGQAITINVNDGDVTFTAVPNGKPVVIASAGLPGAAISEIKVTTADAQTADGYVTYHLFGDPT